jgi:hypothetical protein
MVSLAVHIDRALLTKVQFAQETSRYRCHEIVSCPFLPPVLIQTVILPFATLTRLCSVSVGAVTDMQVDVGLRGDTGGWQDV